MNANNLIDCILEGDSPEQVCDALLEKKITRGMANSFGRGEVKFRCTDCDLAIPKYVGAYPKSCPECGGNLGEP